jgi:D-alanine transaminase
MGWVHVNGEVVAAESAVISIFDRGFLFADGVYEVTSVLDGRLVDAQRHIDRLERSLGELRIPVPHSREAILEIHRDLIARNELRDGVVYLQITRGAGEREFTFPRTVQPSVVAFTQVKELRDPSFLADGVKVVTVPDIRWQRRDIKSVALLAQVLGKQDAADAGAFEGWMVEHGRVTEGTTSTAFIVDKHGKLITRPLTNAVLPGVTRLAVLDLVDEAGLGFEERTFSVEEAYEATEAFLTSASTFVAPVVEIDGHRIGHGRPGLIATRLREMYVRRALEAAE